MQPSTSGKLATEGDEIVGENGELEPTKGDVTVVAMVDLDNDQYEGEMYKL